MIYEPAEDSYLLQEQVKKYSINKKVLDMGTGSGIQAVTSKNSKSKSVLACDINQECIDFVNKKGIKCVKSNLFSNINEKFDLIIFNPPYLPLDEREPKDSQISTTGGKKGNEIVIKFLKQAKNYLNKDGKILIVVSTLTPQIEIIIEKNKFKYKKLSEKKLSFEKLIVYLIQR